MNRVDAIVETVEDVSTYHTTFWDDAGVGIRWLKPELQAKPNRQTRCGTIDNGTRQRLPAAPSSLRIQIGGSNIVYPRAQNMII